ncbi:MAG: biotin/lipoyl-binding protein [Bacteroidales bacterium]|nr:biotin/lipoyl-binding protein [Bacteroidales bacterium]
MKEYKFKINGSEYKVNINEVEGQEMKMEVNGTAYTVTVDKEMRAQKPRTTIVTPKPAPRVAAAAGEVQRSTPAPAAGGAGNKLNSPLPGTILDVFVNVGDTVKAGQSVVLLEAMKMENNIEADVDGTVTAVNVRKGDAVLEGQNLIVIG